MSKSEESKMVWVFGHVCVAGTTTKFGKIAGERRSQTFERYKIAVNK